MSSASQKPTLDFHINIPDFTLMRITPPLMLNPLQFTPLQLDYSTSQYMPFPEDVLQKIGVKQNEKGGFVETFISGLACMSCTACKAMSRDTLMQINSKDLQPIEKETFKNPTVPTEEEEPIDQQKREKYQQIWKSEKKRHLRPSIVKFDIAFRENHKLSQKQWEEKVKTFFQ